MLGTHYQLFYKNFVLMCPVSDDLKIFPPQSVLIFIPLEFSYDVVALQISLNSILIPRDSAK